MNKDKQIEEMAYEMTQYKETVCERIEHNKCLLTFHTNAFINCHFCKLAEHLITEKGYRKASEVAREIFEEIEGIMAYFPIYGHANTAIVNENDFAELKKKYTEGER